MDFWNREPVEPTKPELCVAISRELVPTLKTRQEPVEPAVRFLFSTKFGFRASSFAHPYKVTRKKIDIKQHKGTSEHMNRLDQAGDRHQIALYLLGRLLVLVNPYFHFGFLPIPSKNRFGPVLHNVRYMKLFKLL